MTSVALPPAPEGVRVLLRDGSEHPAELVYEGPSAKGRHMWRVTAMFPLKDIKSIMVDLLPAHTAIRLGARR